MDGWKNSEIVNNYLLNTRKSIPLGVEQIDLMLRIISKALPRIEYFVDLGCGDGFLSKIIFMEYPEARGLLVDFSQPMIEAAKENLKDYPDKKIVYGDFATAEWKLHLDKKPDLVLSGYAIHHLPDEKKYGLYKNIFEVLADNGMFLNIEHVASASKFGNELFDEIIVDTLYRHLKEQGKEKDKKILMEEFKNRLDKTYNILTPVNIQCGWLNEIGFKDVDCFFKCFELAIFGGIKKVTGGLQKRT